MFLYKLITHCYIKTKIKNHVILIETLTRFRSIDMKKYEHIVLESFWLSLRKSQLIFFSWIQLIFRHLRKIQQTKKFEHRKTI